MTNQSAQSLATRRRLVKLVVVLFLVVTVSILLWYLPKEILTLEYLQSHFQSLRTHVDNNPWESLIIFFSSYVFLIALSFPGASLLTILAGGLFGLGKGLIVVSLASTIGATLAFLVSRYLLQDFFSKKFSEQFSKINREFEHNGTMYLLTLRLIPVFPFFLINLLMGLTTISSVRYFFISMLGMLPGTFVYVYAGLSFSKIQSVRDILSPDILLSFVLLGILPYIGKGIVTYLKNRKIYSQYNRPAKFDYNMIVIGGGSAGLVAAYIGSAVKAKVALVEKHQMGGDCLNTGCVPSKSLIKSSKIISLQKKAREYGLKKIDVDFEFRAVMERVQKIITQVAPHDSRERYTKLGVECFTGVAEIISPWEVKIGGKIYTTKFITVATGAGPLIPKIAGIEKNTVLTSDTIWSLRELPQKLLVVGGGAIGVELAQCFRRMGSEVYIVEGGEFLLGREDHMTSLEIKKALQEEGIQLLLNHTVVEFKAGSIIVRDNVNNKVLELSFDQVLMATGRSPNTTGFGLEKLGIKINADKTIWVDEYMQTSIPNIFASGDVAGPYQFTHAASHQSWYVAVNSLFGVLKKFKVDYRVLPKCTYTDPEVASVGLMERDLLKEQVDFDETIYHLDDLDRAIIDGETKGFVRVFTKKGSDKILGATIVSSQASLMILEIVTAMKYNLGLNKILGTIHAYPGMGEANKYAAGVWKRAQTSKKVLVFLEKFHTWRRG